MNETKTKNRRIQATYRKIKVGEEDKKDLEYRLSRSPEERFEAVHQIRRDYALRQYGSFRTITKSLSDRQTPLAFDLRHIIRRLGKRVPPISR